MIPIAREVRVPLLVIGALLAFADYRTDSFAIWLAWLVFATLLFLSRDFKRIVPAIPLAVVSPVDGKVREITEVQDPYLKRTAQGIRVRQSLLGEFNVHSPIEGKIQDLWSHSLTSLQHPQLAIWVQTDERDDVVMMADLRSVLRHATCRVNAGERIGQGQRCGLMAIACEMQIYLPLTARVTVKVGQSVRAGSDKLAEFVHKT